jgi:terminase small subunit / prophage DNA-packing protein
MGTIVNRKGMGDIIGVTPPTIDAWIAEGMPVKVKGAKGREYQLDTEDVISWMLQRERDRFELKAASKSDDPDEPINSNEAKRRLEVAKALSAELDLAEQMKLVAPVEMIARVLSNEIANARARLLAIPNKIRPDIQKEVPEPEGTKRLVNRIDTLIFEALTEIKMSTDEAPKETADV